MFLGFASKLGDGISQVGSERAVHVRFQFRKVQLIYKQLGQDLNDRKELENGVTSIISS